MTTKERILTIRLLDKNKKCVFTGNPERVQVNVGKDGWHHGKK